MIIPKIVEFFETLSEDKRDRFNPDILSGKYYVYVLMYPDGTVFYVGKGKGNRIDQHETEACKGIQSPKCDVIRKIWIEGGEIIKQKVAYFDNEEDAYELEELLIAFFDRKNLTNLTNGGEGAGIGNTNAKKNGRLHVTFNLSISGERLMRVCKYLESLGIEPTDQAVIKFVREELYKRLDEMTKHIVIDQEKQEA